MGDAEIIPLGTRGRPGRGTGRDKPSSSSRSLAGGTPPATGADEPGTTAVDDATTQPSTEATEATVAELGAPVEIDQHETSEVEPPAVDAPGPVVSEPSPTVDVPFGELLSAATRAAQVVFGEDADQKLAQLLAFLRRRVTGDYEVDEYGMDPELTQRFLLEMVRPLATKWFRVEVRGIENIPTDGGALVVANHSGTVPMDGLVTMFAIHETTGRNLRPLGADLVFRLPFVGELARKAGATLACNEDAVRMLSKGELAAVWPEGFKGVGKPYSERYKLQRFGRGGFVSAAI